MSEQNKLVHLLTSAPIMVPTVYMTNARLKRVDFENALVKSKSRLVIESVELLCKIPESIPKVSDVRKSLISQHYSV